MKLQDLFEMCENLGHGTVVIVRNEDSDYVDEGSYPDMHALYGDKTIVSFRIEDRLHATVNIAGLKAAKNPKWGLRW